MFRSTPSNSADSGGNKPPTSLTLHRQVSQTTQSWIGGNNPHEGLIGTSESSAVTSATLTEVLNITGSGVLKFAGQPLVRNSKLR